MNLFEFPERRPVYKNKSLIPNTPDAFGSADAFFGRKQESVIPTMGAYAPSKAPLGKTPKVYNPEIPLFSDEQKMLQRMKADNLSDEQAYGMLKQRRTDLLGGSTKIGADEKQILMKMQADNLSAKEATNMIQQRRYDKEKESFNKAYESGNLAQKGAYNFLALGAGNLETIATYGGNLLDFATFGKLGFGEEVKKMEEVTQSPQFQESTAFKAGTYLPDVALAVSPIGGGYMAGAKGMTGLQGANLFSKVGLGNASQGLMARSAVVGAGFGATQPVLEKGSDATMGDIATGAGYGAVAGAVSAPVFGKAFKYGQAGYYGGATGIGKSITRDVKGAGQTIKNIGTAIAPKGANISTRANRFNALDEQKFIQATGQTPGEFATTRGMTKVGDDAVVEATNAWQASKAQADEAFGAIEGNFRIGGDKDFINGAIEGLQGKLSKYSPEIERVNQLATKYQNEGLTMSEVNELKRLYSANHKYSFLDSGSKQAIESRDIQDGLRTWQFKVAEQNGLSNIAEINKNTQAWKMYADSLAKKLNRGVANNANTLTDWIVLGGGNPENIALYLGKKLASSDLTKRTAIKLFSKQTKPSIIKPNIAEIQQSNFQKNVNRGISSNRDNSGGESMVRVAGLLPEPTGKATGAKNVRVNQPMEKSPIVNEGQKGARPITPQKKEAQKLLPAPRLPAGTSLPRTDIVAESMRGATKVKAPVTPTPVKKVTPKKITPTEKVEAKKVETVSKEVKYTPEQRTSIMDKGEYDKSFYDKIVKEGKTSDDLLSSEFMFGPEDKYVLKNNAVNKRYNELLKQENNDKIATLQKQIENTKDIKKGALDERIKRETETYNFHNENAKTDTGLAKEYEQIQAEYYKKKIELLQKANGRVTIKSPTKTTVNLSQSKGGFIKIPEIGKKVEPLVEEVKKYNSPNDAFGGKDVLYHGTTMDNLESIFKKGLLNIKDDKSSIKKIYLSSNIKDSERYTKIYPSKKPLLLAVKDSIEFGPEGSRGVRTDFMSTRTISPKEIAFRDDTTGKWVLLSDIYKTPVKNPLNKQKQ